MKYMKLPIVVDAFCWTGDVNQTEDPVWIVDAIKAGEVWFAKDSLNNTVMQINTLEGTMTAIHGDWIIRGIDGEIYPCKSSIFNRTYSSVDYNRVMPTREICKICYHVNPIGFKVPQKIWSAVNPFQENDCVICLPCFVRLADEKMIQWDKDIQFFPVSLKTHLKRCEYGD